ERARSNAKRNVAIEQQLAIRKKTAFAEAIDPTLRPTRLFHCPLVPPPRLISQALCAAGLVSLFQHRCGKSRRGRGSLSNLIAFFTLFYHPRRAPGATLASRVARADARVPRR